jgi:hypothetical protein
MTAPGALTARVLRMNLPTIRLLITLCLLSLLSAGLHAQEKRSYDPINPLGQPRKLRQGKGEVFAIWYADNHWHVRVSSREGDEKKEVFTGTIEIEGGQIASGKYDGMERNGKPRNRDWIYFHANNRIMDFQFVNFGKLDGFDFRPSDKAKSVTFKLLIDGVEVPRRVLIGSQSEHPKSMPFTLPAHPENK